MLEPANILLVDDQPVNLMALQAVLEGPDRQLVAVQSGREALHEVSERDFALILLDVNMPVMDGYETATQIRNRDRSRHTPIIFVTAMSATDIRVFEGYSRGAVDFIIKPFDPRVLRSKVNVFIELERHIREVRRLNEQLAARTIELSEANRELESFAHTVSHDLRTPLRAIRGFAAVLAEHPEALEESGRDALHRIQAASARMTALIDDLLRLAHVSRVSLRRSTIDLSALARTITGALQASEPQRKVKWDICEDLSANADPGLARVLLENLLGNAHKYTRGKPHPCIMFGRATAPSGAKSLVVRDNGSGFDMADVADLFTPFRRLHSEREFEGTGIGLATVDRIVRRHGGWVQGLGEPGIGAAFWFSFGDEEAEP